MSFKSPLAAALFALAMITASIAETPPRAQAEKSGTESGMAEAAYAGGETCVSCHEDQARAWRGSHHDLAMRVADEKTVLGDFNNISLKHHGVTTTFFQRGKKFMVRTEGADGKKAEFEIAYTFGADPLQQYLIPFGDGRMQVLGAAWDSRAKQDGGQRWFHLYRDRDLKAGDPLHWTGVDQTWNHMCAECHSTVLRKNYVPEENRFETSWSDVNVNCEACHGPGADHVAWATAPGAKDTGKGDKGLTVDLSADIDDWSFEAGAKIAARNMPASRTELNVCAKCHSRRAPLSAWDHDDKNLLQSHNLQLLFDGYYFPDGQIRDEVFVLGSFLQSKMYQAGVTCSNCHDPHSLKTRAKGNALCAQCHAPDAFDTPKHHFHPADTDGAQCVSCHMPERTYMVVDPRRDHGFHSPRPDLSETLGVPNACTGCHADKDAAWASAELASRFGAKDGGDPHFAQVLSDARKEVPGSGDPLARIIADKNAAPIVRATALAEIGPFLTSSRPAIEALAGAVSDADPVIRFGAAQVLPSLPPRERLQLGAPMLDDPMLAVRVAAASGLVTLPRRQLPENVRAIVDKAGRIYKKAQEIVADRPEGQVNIGNIHMARGEFAEAEAAFRTALRLDPRFTAGSVNLADLYRLRNRDGDGEAVLKTALSKSPDAAELQYSMGLLLVRQKRLQDALAFLERAASLQPGNARYGYTYGLALQGAGQKDAARAMLKTMLQRHPYNGDLLNAMVSYSLETGNIPEATGYVRRLAAVRPNDRDVARLLQRLEATGGKK